MDNIDICTHGGRTVILISFDKKYIGDLANIQEAKRLLEKEVIQRELKTNSHPYRPFDNNSL
jgi:hypothetical protein